MRGNVSASVHRLRTNTVYGRGCVLGCVRTLSLSVTLRHNIQKQIKSDIWPTAKGICCSNRHQVKGRGDAQTCIREHSHINNISVSSSESNDIAGYNKAHS